MIQLIQVYTVICKSISVLLNSLTYSSMTSVFFTLVFSQSMVKYTCVHYHIIQDLMLVKMTL